MANSFTNITDKILARGLTVLREAAIMPRLVNVDFNTEAASKGSTIDVPKSVSQTVADVSAGAANITPASKTPGLVQVSMSNWKKTDFFMTDKEMLEVDRNQNFVPHQTEEAARALANDIDTAIHNQYTGIYGFVGGAGAVPFSTVKTATDARKVLNQQLAPVGPARSIVLDPTAESQALQLPAYSDVEKTEDRPVKIEGEIGRKFGFDHFMSQNVVTHTAGTLQSVGAVVGSTTAAGAAAVDLKSSGATGNLVLGDVFTIAGDSQTYVVTSTVTAIASGAAKSVGIAPPLKAIASANAAVAIKATHVVNLAFHRNAFVYVTRPLVEQISGEVLGGGVTRALVDNVTGLALRLEVLRQNKQTAWEFDVLYGTKLVRPEFAARIAG